MSNSLRDEVKDVIAAALTGGQTIPDSADYEMAARIADAVFGVEEPVASCDLCGKDLFDAETGIAVSTGEIVEQDGGFMSDDCAWLYVACKDCGAKITDAIEKLIDEEGKK